MVQQNIISDEYKQQIRCVTHEIRNHLSICDMYSQIIKKNLDKSGIESSSIENAINCIQQSIKIIGANLLDLKSINVNNSQLFDFEKLIQKGAELGKAYIGDKNIEFEVFVKNTALIKVDENRFLACIVNIIKNAIEAIEIKGKISINAEIKSDTGLIKITNDGKAIPKEKQDLIFETGYTSKKTGSGLGLAICKKYLEEQGAKLELVKSNKNQTTFEIKIPISKL